MYIYNNISIAIARITKFYNSAANSLKQTGGVMTEGRAARQST